MPFMTTTINWKSQNIPYVHFWIILCAKIYEKTVVTATLEARVAQTYSRYGNKKFEHFIFDENFI
jgi:hypothetical protein